MIKKIIILFILIFAVVIAYQNGKNNGVVKNELLKQENNQLVCPYILKNNPYKNELSPEYDTRIVEEPKFINNPEIIKRDKPFNQTEFEKDLYKLSSDNGWDYREFDVDKDDKNEMIINANFAMNHTPNIAMVVKNKKIIFEATGASIMIDEIPDGNGFLLNETVDWNTGEVKTTRYLYRDGGFLPVFTQKSCWVNFE